MSDLRYDPVFDHWIAVAENRRERPIEFLPLEQVRKPLICPFCVGNEDETPGAVLVLDEAASPLPLNDSNDWLVRVIPNKYPTFENERRARRDAHGPYGAQTGNGLQEVIIPSPRHVVSLSELIDVEFQVALQAAQMRLRSFESHPQIQHGMLFKNCRSEAGASVEHIHLQLIGSPLVSPALARRAQRFSQSVGEHQASLLSRLLGFELEQGTRLVAEGKHWVMFCPYASRQAFQVWVVPRNPSVSFVSYPAEVLAELAELSHHYISRIESQFGQPGYNWMLHQLPFAQAAVDHPLVEIFPRLAKAAGYEMGTEIWINAVSPELAARRLR